MMTKNEFELQYWLKDGPSWWTLYNKVKHHKFSSGSIDGISQEYYKYANLKYTLTALMDLYLLELFSFEMLAANERVKLPLPSSHLLYAVGHNWSEANFQSDSFFYVDEKDGHLYLDTPLFQH